MWVQVNEAVVFNKMKLRDYQKELGYQAFDILAEKGLVYLCMETRTGKTFTALFVCQLLNATKVLVVTKKKAIPSIEKDAAHFDFSTTVINYESVLKAKGSYDVVICDESHSLSAYPRPSQRQKNTKKVVAGKPVILMSATPSPESYSQLYHQFTINGRHFWAQNYRNFYAWAKNYVNKKTKYLYNREIVDYSEAKEKLVRKATYKYMLTFTQEEAGIEQRVTEKVLITQMPQTTYNLIKKIQRDKVYEVNGSAILADAKVKEMQKIHQISSGSVKLEDGSVICFDYSKAQFIKDYFKGQSIAIFYKFMGERMILKEVFDDWTDSPEDFQENGGAFISQFVAGREGIRIDKADAIIFYNIDFSFLSYLQSMNRIVSKEREKEAVLYWVFSDRGIEQEIYKTVKNKADFTVKMYRKWEP